MNKKLIVLISVLTIAGSVQAMEKGWAFHDYLERKKANDKEYLNLSKENKNQLIFSALAARDHRLGAIICAWRREKGCGCYGTDYKRHKRSKSLKT